METEDLKTILKGIAILIVLIAVVKRFMPSTGTGFFQSWKKIALVVLALAFYSLLLFLVYSMWEKTVWAHWMKDPAKFYGGQALILVAVGIGILAETWGYWRYIIPSIAMIAALILLGNNLLFAGPEESTATVDTSGVSPKTKAKALWDRATASDKPDTKEFIAMDPVDYQITNDQWTEVSIPRCDSFEIILNYDATAITPKDAVIHFGPDNHGDFGTNVTLLKVKSEEQSDILTLLTFKKAQ